MAWNCPKCGGKITSESDICPECGAFDASMVHAPSNSKAKPANGPRGRSPIPLRLKMIIALVSLLLVIAPLVVVSLNGSGEDTAPKSFMIYDVKGSYYYAIDSHGSITDSGKDATAIIQKALNSLTIGRTWKEKILIQGNFTIDVSLIVQSFTIIELNGTINLGVGSFSNIVNSFGSNDIDIIGGTWRANPAIEESAIYFKECNNISICKCEFIAGGIAISDCRGVLISNNSVRDIAGEFRQGILVHNTASDIEISYNTISNSRGGGIYVFQRSDGTAKTAKNVWVHHNTLTSIFTDGISLYPEGSINRCQYCTVEYNTITNAGNSGRHTALAVGWGGGSALTAGQGCDYNTIKGNTVVRSGNITLGGYLNVRGDHNLVSSNTIINAQKTAIIMLHANNNTFEGNVVEGTELDSANAFTGTGSSYNSIKNNQFLNPNNNCIQLKLSTYGIACNHNIISGNTMDSPRVCWIYINETANSNNRIMGNYFKNPSFAFPSGIVDIGTNTIIFNNTYL